MAMSVREVPVSEIIVGPRVRRDVGDIEQLAASIRRYGLFHPVVIDRDQHLVSGARRLAAVQGVLGWETISAREYGELSDIERLEIELEENARRLDLTPAERTQADARRFELIEGRLAAERREQEEAAAREEAERAREASAADGGEPTDGGAGDQAEASDNKARAAQKPAAKRGRPAKAESGVPEQQIADEAGVDRRTVQRVREHSTYLGKYGDVIGHLSQEEAIAVGGVLDKLETKTRKDALKRVPSPLPVGRAVPEIHRALRDISREQTDREQARTAEQQSAELEQAETRKAWAGIARSLNRMVELDPAAVGAIIEGADYAETAHGVDLAITWLARFAKSIRPELREPSPAPEPDPEPEPAPVPETVAAVV